MACVRRSSSIGSTCGFFDSASSCCSSGEKNACASSCPESSSSWPDRGGEDVKKRTVVVIEPSHQQQRTRTRELVLSDYSTFEEAGRSRAKARRHFELWSIDNPHASALRFSCPVFTLCNLVKMISMSCKTHTEVFARSLQNKLKFLNSRGSDGELDNMVLNNRYGEHERANQVDNNDLFHCSGTTFPPRRCVAQYELLKDKFCSESALDVEQNQHLSNTLGNMNKRRNNEKDSNNETATGMNKTFHLDNEEFDERVEDEEVGNSNDSDLFFDFDIGSPEEESSVDSSPRIINEDKVQFDGRRDSDESSNSDGSSSDDMAKMSTAYGSASSGLCSDMDGLYSCNDCQREAREEHKECANKLEGLALDLTSWQQHINRQSAESTSSSNSTTTPTTIHEQQSPLTQNHNQDSDRNESSPQDALDEKEKKQEQEQTEVKQDSGSDRNETTNDSSVVRNEKRATDQELESFSVYSGDHKHKIARSKLNSLLALLEKDREYVRKNSIDKNKQRKKSPPKQDDFGGVNIKNRPSATCTFVSGSPANFSFLANGNPSQQSITDDKETRQSSLERCSSTPALNAAERAMMDSPRATRRAISNVSVPNANQESGKMVEDTKSEEDQEEIMSEKPDAMRRASSLKSGKTPPGTPGRRKIVRFADVLGLDLADVRTFLDEVPKVPKSAYKDLKEADLSDMDSDTGSIDNLSASGRGIKVNDLPSKLSIAAAEKSTTSLVPMFNQPGGFPNFFDILRCKKVCLENAFMIDSRSLRGTIRVQNLGFHKRVVVRYTCNEWISETDLEAEYIPGSCDGFSDKFTFFLTTSSLVVGQRVQFCIRYESSGNEFWDNNDGKNYVFQCVSKNPASPMSSVKGASSSNQNFVPIPIKDNNSHGTSSYGHGYSQSPSALSEEPWLRYL